MQRLLIWLLLLVLLRQFPINLASPSPDPLFMILVFFVLIKVIEQINQPYLKSQWKIISVLSFFCVIIKLSTLPVLLLLLVPIFFYRLTKNEKVRWLSFLFFTGIIIIVPWLARNVILSGYLLYPVPILDVFHFDWKVPLDQVIFERDHVANAPRLISNNWAYVQSLPFYEKVYRWLPQVWFENPFNGTMVYIALLSPLIALPVLPGKKKPLMYVWLVAYAGIWFWIYGSPDVRFGYPFLVACLMLPLLVLFDKREINSIGKKVLAIITVASCFYYCQIAYRMFHQHPLHEWIVKPLLHPEQLKNKDLSTFRYKQLNSKVKLYLHDSTHHCINAPFPCSAEYSSNVVLRGQTIADGFKAQ